MGKGYVEQMKAQAELELAQRLEQEQQQQQARDQAIEARRRAWEAQQAFEQQLAELARLAGEGRDNG